MKIIKSNLVLIIFKILLIIIFLFLFISLFIKVDGVNTLSNYLFGVAFGWFTPVIYVCLILVILKYKTTFIFKVFSWKKWDIFFIISTFFAINWITIYFQYFVKMSNYDPKFLSENSILIWWNSLTSSNNSYQPFIWNEGFLSFSSFALFGAIFSQYGIISMSFLLLVLGLIYFGYRTVSTVKKSKKLSNLTINKGVKL